MCLLSNWPRHVLEPGLAYRFCTLLQIHQKGFSCIETEGRLRWPSYSSKPIIAPDFPLVRQGFWILTHSTLRSRWCQQYQSCYDRYLYNYYRLLARKSTQGGYQDAVPMQPHPTSGEAGEYGWLSFGERQTNLENFAPPKPRETKKKV